MATTALMQVISAMIARDTAVGAAWAWAAKAVQVHTDAASQPRVTRCADVLGISGPILGVGFRYDSTLGRTSRPMMRVSSQTVRIMDFFTGYEKYISALCNDEFMSSLQNVSADLSLAIEHLVRAIRVHAIHDPLSLAASSALSRIDAQGPCSITYIAEAERVSQPAMTQLVARLEAQGLVQRTRSQTDRRTTLVSLLPAGSQALNDYRARRTEIIRRGLEQGNITDLASLEHTVTQLEHLVTALKEVPHA